MRPHPHIGLATVTYLFEGEIQHRDSLGTPDHPARRGELDDRRPRHRPFRAHRTGTAQDRALFGIQTWVALPEAPEDTGRLRASGPRTRCRARGRGQGVRLILGTRGATAPVQDVCRPSTPMRCFAPGARCRSPDTRTAGSMLLGARGDRRAGATRRADADLPAGRPTAVTAGARGARPMLLGGAPLGGPRYIWWNFVASSKERIDQAKEDWAQRRFDIVPGDEQDSVPIAQVGPGAESLLAAPRCWRAVGDADELRGVPGGVGRPSFHEIEATGRGDRPAGRPVAFLQGPLQIGGPPLAFPYQLQTAGDRAGSRD